MRFRRGGHVGCSPPAIMQEPPTVRTRFVGVNVPPVERLASVLLGGAAIFGGLRRRSLGGALLAGLGAAAVVRGVSGRSVIYRARAARKGVQVRRAITIQCTPDEAYALWRDLPNLPRFMTHVKSVTIDPDGLSTWVVEQAGKELAWRAEIVEDTTARRLRWKSLPGGDVDHDGSIDIRPALGDRGTIVEVKMHYFPPGGLLVASALYGFLRRLTVTQIGAELARLRQLLETGELTTGARRVADLAKGDKAVSAAGVASSQPPTTQAETSTWTGGAR